MFKTFIIRLEENEHSCKMADECQKQAKLQGIEANFFKAIHADDIDEHYEKTGITRKGKFKKNRAGVVGCFFSHFYLWQNCLDENIPYLILEHDGFILQSIPDNIVNHFNDVLKLDRHDPYSGSYDIDVNNEQSRNLTIQKYINPNPKSPYKTNTGNYFKGAYAYIIKPQGAKKLIRHVNKHGHLPADQQIGDWVVDTKTTIPSLARLHPFYSEGNNIRSESLTRNL